MTPRVGNGKDAAMMMERFDELDLVNFEPDGKVGLIASVDADGLPHVTLITAMQALDPAHLAFGQFCEGRGKRHIQLRPKVGFAFMSLDKRAWRGTATWTRKADSGPEYELFNKKPMWRYNSYFGMHTIHYLDVESASMAEPIRMGAVVAGALKAAVAGSALRARPALDAMNPWTQGLISALGNLKFAAYVEADGFPRLIPQLAAVAVGPGLVYLPGTEYKAELAAVPDGAVVALYAMSLSMETVLVRGRFSRLGAGGVIEIDWVYNSMPPVAERIYPPVDLAAKVTAF